MSATHDQPRKPAIIRQELRELEKASLSSKEWLELHPDDNLVGLLVAQDSIRQRDLLAELELSYRYYRHHYIEYAIKTTTQVEVTYLGSLLYAFKKVLNATLNHVTRQERPFQLFFDAVVEGSFGVLMSTEFERELLNTTYERTFQAFFATLERLAPIETLDEKQLLEVFENDLALMRKYRSFYRSVANCGSSVGVTWRGILEAHRKEGLIDHKEALDVYNSLAQADHPKSEDIESHGSIQGINLLDKTIIFVPYKQKGARVKLCFVDEFTEQLKKLLGRPTTVLYRITSEYDEDTDRIVTTKSLLGMDLKGSEENGS